MALIFGNFKDHNSARNAVYALIEQGFSGESINILMKQSSANSSFPDSSLKGISKVRFPETGEMLAAGQLAHELAVSVPLTNNGSLDAALKSFLPHNAALNYLDTLYSGGVLIWVNSDDKASQVEQILFNENGKQIVILE